MAEQEKLRIDSVWSGFSKEKFSAGDHASPRVNVTKLGLLYLNFEGGGPARSAYHNLLCFFAPACSRDVGRAGSILRRAMVRKAQNFLRVKIPIL